MNTSPYDMYDQMKELVTSTKTLVTLVSQLTGGLKKTKKESKDIANESDKIEKNVKGIAKAVKAVALDEVVRAVKNVSVSTKEIRSMQVATGADINKWNKAFKSMSSSAREINSALDKAAFNSKDFLAAAEKLASIGWSDLKSLSNVAPALAKINKAVGDTTASFNKSVLNLQKVFKDGTAELVEGLGNSLASYSKILGVTSEQLENAAAKMTAQITRLSQGNQDLANQMYENLSKAVSLGGQMGLDESSVENLMYKVANASANELAGLAQAFGMADQSVIDVQGMAASGQYYEAMQALVEGIAASQSGDTMLDNIYKEQFASLGLSADAIDNIVSNMDNFDEYLRNIQSASEATQGALDGRIGEQLVSFPERIMNVFSNSPIMQGFTNLTTKLGIGSPAETIDMAKNIKAMLPADMFKKADGSKGFDPKALLSIGKFAAIAAIAGAVLSKLMQNEGLQKAIQTLQQVLGKLLDALGGIIDAIAGVLSNILEKVAEIFAKLIESLMPIFELIVDIVQELGTILNGIAEFLNGIIDAIIDPLVSLLETIFNAVKSALDVLIPIIETILGVLTNLLKMLMPVIEVIIRVLSLVMNMVGGIIQKMIEEIAGIFEALSPVLNVILEAISTVFELFGTVFEAVSTLVDVIFDVLDPIMTLFIDLLEPVLQPISNILKLLNKLILPLLKPFTMMIQGLASVIKFIGPVVNMILSIFKPIISGLQSIGNWLADIKIFGWHPFGFLRSETTAPEAPGISEDEYDEVTNKTTQEEYDKTAGGMVYRYGLMNAGFHTGDDIPMAVGTPLSAAQAGLVTSEGYNDTYGNYVSLLGNDGIQRLFGHMNSTDVSAGDFVMPGQSIGESGNTGDSLEPHVHYETRQNGRFVDPLQVARAGGNNADVVQAIQVMTARLENKLEEISQRTDENEKWIKEFDKRVRSEKFDY